jgi:hypothetical protein
MSDQQQAPPPGSPQGPQLTIKPEVALGQYANFVSIAHNYSEVLLDFGRTLPGRKEIPVVARVIMNPFQAKQLLRALSHNLEMYEKSFGPVPNPPTAPAPPSAPPTETPEDPN